MLAYTVVGDGVISFPALYVRTFEDGTRLSVFLLAGCLYQTIPISSHLIFVLYIFALLSVSAYICFF